MNFSTGESQFLPLDSQEPVCTTLGDVLTIVSGTANYNVQVADSSGFTVGDIVAIGTVNQRFEVTAVPNATHVTGTFHPTLCSMRPSLRMSTSAYSAVAKSCGVHRKGFVSLYPQRSTMSR